MLTLLLILSSAVACFAFIHSRFFGTKQLKKLSSIESEMSELACSELDIEVTEEQVNATEGAYSTTTFYELDFENYDFDDDACHAPNRSVAHASLSNMSRPINSIGATIQFTVDPLPLTTEAQDRQESQESMYRNYDDSDTDTILSSIGESAAEGVENLLEDLSLEKDMQKSLGKEMQAGVKESLLWETISMIIQSKLVAIGLGGISSYEITAFLYDVISRSITHGKEKKGREREEGEEEQGGGGEGEGGGEGGEGEGGGEGGEGENSDATSSDDDSNATIDKHGGGGERETIMTSTDTSVVGPRAGTRSTRVRGYTGPPTHPRASASANNEDNKDTTMMVFYLRAFYVPIMLHSMMHSLGSLSVHDLYDSVEKSLPHLW